MAANKQEQYGNSSISMLKGEDRVRKRPAVIFGSDDLEGCKHAVFEILSNAIDEAREGHGDTILVTRYEDLSVEVEDFGRGCPVDYNEKEKRYNWELVFCEMYAGGKYNTGDGGNYEFSLGLNGLGLCATQYASEYMDVEIFRDGQRFTLSFRKGENVGGLHQEPYKYKSTGTRIRWKPDLDVFTEIDIPKEYFENVLKRQAVVNAGVLLVLRYETDNGFEETEYCYQDGITDYLREIVGENTENPAQLTPVQYWQCERTGRDREDKPEYRVVLNIACCFSNRVKLQEYYHNSSHLEHGGTPEKAVRAAFVYQIDSYLKQGNKYLKGESKITFADVDECLVLVSSSFSTQTSYENQTKKSITNRFIYEAMNEFLRHQLEVYFIENPD
ncbi:MAG: ATP-binding protein, partial [Clostridiales bacterium]|nr:ATP-binding protein [Clostridiales bacterium]